MRAKRITAKYASTCPSCRRPIVPGERVWWARGLEVAHVDCRAAANKAAEAEARERLHECHECKAPESAKCQAHGPYTLVLCPPCLDRWLDANDFYRQANRPQTAAPDRFDMDYEDDCARRCGL